MVQEQIIYLADLLNNVQNKKIVMVTGPLFSKEVHLALQFKYKKIKFVKTSNHTQQFISKSKLVISHCGYNTLMESLINCKHVVVFPRLTIRKEQIYRAQYFKEKGYCDYINYKNSNKCNLKKIDYAFRYERKIKLDLKNCLNNNLKKLFWLN